MCKILPIKQSVKIYDTVKILCYPVVKEIAFSHYNKTLCNKSIQTFKEYFTALIEAILTGNCSVNQLFLHPL